MVISERMVTFVYKVKKDWNMYEKYLDINTIPARAILKRILLKKGITQKKLAEDTGILRQRINDYITGKRRISAEVSLKLEKALDITIPGFFYKIQSNHDLYLAIQAEQLKQHPDYSLFRKCLFWDTDMEKLNWESNKKWIIQRVFEYGNDLEIKATIHYYGENVVTTNLNAVRSKWKENIREVNSNKYLR